MSFIRNKLVSDAINNAYLLIDYDKNEEGQYESIKQTILSDESLSHDEKLEAINIISKNFDGFKILDNEGTKRICENCQEECLAKLYCGCSEIYTADWIDGRYEEWDSKEKQLKRFGAHEVVLKKLENIENTNRNWLDETRSHFAINNKYGSVVQCYGLTKDQSNQSNQSNQPNESNENYILVMNRMKMNLREYLQQNCNNLTWKRRIKIADDIIFALSNIHEEKVIHRDLHSGNILFDENSQIFYISDLGFCGPADVPLDGTYGNLPYIAPEVLSGKETTFKSDIYSIEQCWDADPSKRPDISHLDNKIFEINKLYHQNNNDEQLDVLNISDVNISISVNSLISSFSKIHIFGEMPEPRNFTEEEREAYYSNQQDFVIPDSRYIFGRQTENNDSTDKNVKGEKFKKIKLSEDEETQFDNKGEFNYIREHYITNTTNDDMNIDDGDDTYNNPNLHSEEQDELEIFED
ncbi:kinase-like domain-containing protein [Rhizophagus irregularis DAOM 181602=DAOM 197198]|nr:kinase-like domain-containing protein [Rhizophagus irregularis DAOM 181602=DAOM 197198]